MNGTRRHHDSDTRDFTHISSTHTTVLSSAKELAVSLVAQGHSYFQVRRVRRGGFPLPGNPPNVPNEQRFWAYFGRVHDRSSKNAKLQQIVTQSNSAQIQQSKYPGRIENSQLSVEIICDALRAISLEINCSLVEPRSRNFKSTQRDSSIENYLRLFVTLTCSNLQGLHL